MTIKKIYAFPERGILSSFAHFFFGLLIPLLYYDIQTKHSHTFIIKTNVGVFSKILQELFLSRIYFNYDVFKQVNEVISNQSDRYNYFKWYIHLLKNKNNTNDIILINSCDIFGNYDYKLINKNMLIDYNKLEYLERKYIKLSEYKINSDVKDQNTILNFNKTLYNVLRLTDKYFNLINYKISIDRYLHRIYNKNIYTHTILLIERPFVKFNIDNVKENTSGQRRLIYNHTELKNRLSKLYKTKFMNVSLDNVTFEEQYYLFKNTKIIIAQHGAALCNIYLSKSNYKTHLIEISPKWVVNLNDWFKNLSELCEINYYRVIQPGMTNSEWGVFSKKNNINYHGSQEIFNSFIENSGSVNINEIVNIIENIV